MAINSTAVWRVRPSGSDTNGAGYDPGIAGAGTDYSRQNAAQLSLTDLTSTGSASLDVSSATGGFTAAMVGNSAYISGTGLQAGRYFITARASANTVTLDRTPATSASATTGGTCNVGGAALNVFALAISGTGQVSPGNTVYIYSPNPTNRKVRTTLNTSAITGTGTGLTATLVSATNVPASGFAIIDAEVVTYTLSGTTITVTGRGQVSSTAVAHVAGAPFTVLDYAANRTATAMTVGSSTVGKINYRSDPSGGRPSIYTAGANAFWTTSLTYSHFDNITFLWGRPSSAGLVMINVTFTTTFKNCNFMLCDTAVAPTNSTYGINGLAICLGCVFEAEATNVVQANNATCFMTTGVSIMHDCSFLNLNIQPVNLTGTNANTVHGCLFYNCALNPINVLSGTLPVIITSNTFDNNGGYCLVFNNAANLASAVVIDNIFSNNTGASTACVSCTTGTAAVNDSLGSLLDNNVFFNNAANYSAFTGRTNDITTTDPGYTNAAGLDHSIGPALKALAYPTIDKGDTRTYLDPGAYQRQEAAGAAATGSGATITFVG